jgi:hypothetical protein
MAQLANMLPCDLMANSRFTKCFRYLQVLLPRLVEVAKLDFLPTLLLGFSPLIVRTTPGPDQACVDTILYRVDSFCHCLVSSIAISGWFSYYLGPKPRYCVYVA